MKKKITFQASITSFLGFTLIEIMVVVVILAVLATFVLPSIMERPDEARKVKIMQDLRVIESSLKLYRLDNFVYPSQDVGLSALVTKPDNAPNWKSYLDRLPKDPWGNDYQYQNPGTNNPIDIYSLGSDGTKGGEGSAKDIGNWELR